MAHQSANIYRTWPKDYQGISMARVEVDLEMEDRGAR